MTKLILSLQPQTSGKTFVYNYCESALELTFWKPLKRNEAYSIHLYNSRLMLLCCATTNDEGVEKSGKTVRVCFREKHVWIPGKYFILLRGTDGQVTRHDLRLDEAGIFRTEGTSVCPKMSDEDMLSGRLYNCKTQWKLLSRKPGTMQLKRWVIERARQNELNRKRSEMQKKEVELCNNLLISSQTTDFIGASVMLLLHSADINSEHMFGHLDQFYDTTKSNPYEAMTEFFNEVKPRADFFSLIQDTMKAYTFVFSNLSALSDSGGKLIMKTIQAHWPAGNKSAVFYGTQQEIAEMLKLYPSLEQHFPAENRLSIEPYTHEEMILTFFEEAKMLHLSFSAEAVEKACTLLLKAWEQGSTARPDRLFLRRYLEQDLMPKYMRRAIADMSVEKTFPQKGKEEEASPDILPCDIDDDFFLRQSSHYDEALEELRNMVGLTDIKQSIRTLSGQMKFFRERRLLGLRTTTAASHHIILTGNPGTGKTTVAKLLGKIYHSLGLLSKGGVVCADRSTIVGRYIGETEENMKQLLKEAQGNVLFIDEAYTLYSQSDERDFGRHAVECLLGVLSQKDPDMLVVFAGYKNEMDALMSMNPGLVGRFPYRFHFPNYTPEELMQIAEKMLSADQYQLCGEARDLLMQSIREAVRSRSESFGNVRWVEQFVRNGIIPALAERVTSLPHALDKATFQRIEADDVRAAAEKFNHRTVELRHRPAIGFCA